MLLKDMGVGQKGRIVKLLSSGLHSRRLCEMGFLPGTSLNDAVTVEVEVIG